MRRLPLWSTRHDVTGVPVSDFAKHTTHLRITPEGGRSWGVYPPNPSLVVKGDSGAVTLREDFQWSPVPGRSSLAGPDALGLRYAGSFGTD